MGPRLAGILAAALVSAACTQNSPAAAPPTPPAAPAINVAVDGVIYPPLRTSGLVGDWAALSGSLLSSEAAAQAGGFWRADDATQLRGVAAGRVEQQLLRPGPYPACPAGPPACVTGPLPVDVLLGGTEGAVDALIPRGQIDSAGNPGTCQADQTTTCPGLATSTALYAQGHLVIYSCAPGWSGVGEDPGLPGKPARPDSNGSGEGAPGSPNCKAPPVVPAVGTMAGLVAWLNAAPGNRLAIAEPSTDPYGAASVQALLQAGFPVSESAAAHRNAFPAGTQAGECEGPLPAGAICKIRLESGASDVRGAVTSGTVQIGLVAEWSVARVAWTSGTKVGPARLSVPGRDPNVASPIPASFYSKYGPIEQWGVVLTHPGQTSPELAAALRFLTFVTSPRAAVRLAPYRLTSS